MSVVVRRVPWLVVTRERAGVNEFLALVRSHRQLLGRNLAGVGLIEKTEQLSENAEGVQSLRVNGDHVVHLRPWFEATEEPTPAPK